MTETVLSKNNIPIRLTDERWAHITEEHCEQGFQGVITGLFAARLNAPSIHGVTHF